MVIGASSWVLVEEIALIWYLKDLNLYVEMDQKPPIFMNHHQGNKMQ
jgi:hypothetical protein